MGSYTTQPDFATEATAITPSDTTNATTHLGEAALYIGTGGDVTVRLRKSSTSVTFKNVSDGCWLPVICDYVLATGTTAADIVAVK